MAIEGAKEKELFRGELLLVEVFAAEVEVGKENKLCGCGPST